MSKDATENSLLAPTHLRAMVFITFCMFSFACMSVAIRALAEHLPSGQMVLLRNALSFLLVVAFISAKHRGLPPVRTTRLSQHAARAVIGFIAMEIWFYCLSIMPVTIVTALSFTAPVFVTIIAIVFLGERAGWHRWSAIIIAFLGVWLILRPDVADVPNAAVLVLVAAAMQAFAALAVKVLSRTEHPDTIVFYMALFMTPLSVPFALVDWRPISAEAWYLVALVALFSTIAQLLLARSYALAPMVVLAPFDFIRLPVAALLAYPLFGEVMDAQAWCGAAIITGATVYITWREHTKKRKRPPAQAAL